MDRIPDTGGGLAVGRARFTALRDEVFERMIEAITTGELRAGTRLIETEVAEQLGVSKTPLREALVRLARMGLVVARPRRGTYVAAVGPDLVRDIFALRGLMEGYVAAEAARRLTDDDLRELAGLLDQLDVAAARGDLHAVWDHDLAFHQRLYELSGSPLFLETWNLFRDQVRLWHRISSGLPGAEVVAADRRLHQPLFDTLRARDPAAAEAAAREHVEAGIRMLGLHAPIGNPA